MALAYRVALIGVLTALPAAASEADLFRQLSSEYADCFAYYTIAKQCAPDDAKPDELSKLQSEIDGSGDMTLSTGRTAGLTDDAVGTRYVEALQALMSVLGDHCEKFADLRQKHEDACRLLLEHPEQRTKEIIESLNR
jgi:hypothetical protein